MDKLKIFFKKGCLLPIGIFIVGFIGYAVYQSYFAARVATLGACKTSEGCLYTAINGNRSVTVVGFSPDGSRFLTRGGEHLIHDAATGDELVELDLGNDTYRLKISEDGQEIIATHKETIQFFNWDGELIRYWTHAEGFSTRDVAMVPMVKGFAVTDNAGISIWKNSDGSRVTRLYEGEGFMALTTSLTEDRLAAYNSIDDKLMVWDLQNLDDAFAINDVVAKQIQFTEDGSLLLVGTEDGVYVRNAGNGDLLNVLETETNNATAFDFSKDGNLVAIGYETGHVVVWNVSQNEIVGQFAHNNRPRSLALSPDGSRLAVGLNYDVKISGGGLVFNNRRHASYNPIIRQSSNRTDRTPGYAIVWSLLGDENE